MKRSERGFTLIELLVVIAIIGILSSIVLASLNTARAKGANAAIKGNLANMRAQAAIYYDGPIGLQSYGATASTCTTAASMFLDPVITNALNAIIAANGGTLSSAAGVVCNSTATSPAAFAIEAFLKVAEGSNLYWCVDSTGASKGEPAVLGAATVCT